MYEGSGASRVAEEGKRMKCLIVDDVDGGSRCGAEVAQARNTQMTYSSYIALVLSANLVWLCKSGTPSAGCPWKTDMLAVSSSEIYIFFACERGEYSLTFDYVLVVYRSRVRRVMLPRR